MRSPVSLLFWIIVLAVVAAVVPGRVRARRRVAAGRRMRVLTVE